METTGNFITRFPNDVYSIIPKTLIFASLIYVLTKSWLLTCALGIPGGLLLHLIPNAFDCKVILSDSVLIFYFLHPWFYKEMHDLANVDYAVIEPEKLDKTMKEVWWRAEELWPIGYSRLLLYKNGSLAYTLNFRTNAEDTLQLAKQVSNMFPSEKYTLHL